MKDRIVLATGNRNKLREMREILKDFPLELLALDTFPPLPEAVEDGATFTENAVKKAAHYAALLALPCMADDSGLVVEALAGRPGVFSARYAGPAATDWENCEKLLRKMDGQTNQDAYFACVLALVAPDGQALTWEGRCNGRIITERRGEHGFGYDPLFLLTDFNKTLAEIPLAQKSAYSHRGEALASFMAEFQAVQVWLRERTGHSLPAA